MKWDEGRSRRRKKSMSKKEGRAYRGFEALRRFYSQGIGQRVG